jgi:glyoxylase-like metal-dependent hydrolase (beta-lactamase superfamily II)/rhodanese-related sulfurtransferase
MFFKQFYLGCLAQASYMIGSEGEAAVVDPRRDVEEYLEAARANGLSIRHVIETHLHADFVSGHRELAERTGAKIYFGAKAGARFDHVAVREGDEIRMGSVGLRFLETPGHTPESVSVLVFDRSASAEPQAVLTGDTLFIGDVGRPDLLGAKMPAGELAGMLYDSLHDKLLALPDSVAVWPGHGAGSLCGRNIGSETSSTIGQQRRFNYALQTMSRDEFVRMMTADLPEAPAYFGRDVETNRGGASNLGDLPKPERLSPAEVGARQRSGAIILDTRPGAAFGAGHVPGAVHIGLGGQFASWAGTLLPGGAPIVLVTEDEGQVAEAQIRLARVGIESVKGFLDGGVAAWDAAGQPLAKTEQVSVDELAARIAETSAGQVLDVRRPGEWKTGHIASAVHIPLNELASRAEQLDRARPVQIICASGYRSSIATSLLERGGFQRLTNVIGGMNAWAIAGHENTKPEA